ncbi:unnamed protein product [Enterobius vermicularis]|uniref:C2H2-type domain-containing protein n=1 Tax=Enterobius vermicularis TaxID=51028 RepID=A0A158Q9Y6_ENTVE|nr:unnamed protein product [Enterobius vermicularis]
MGKDVKVQKKEERKALKRHVCPECSKAFSFPNKLRNHIQSSHSCYFFYSPVKKVFLWNSTFMDFECTVVEFDRFNQLRAHVAHAHKIRYNCPICAYSSSVKAELKKHITVNHENGVRCTIDGCSMTVAYRMLMLFINCLLLLTGENSRRFSCSVVDCKKKFHREKELRRHRIRFHNILTRSEEEEYKFICENLECGRRFRTASGLRQHSASHESTVILLNRMGFIFIKLFIGRFSSDMVLSHSD